MKCQKIKWRNSRKRSKVDQFAF